MKPVSIALSAIVLLYSGFVEADTPGPGLDNGRLNIRFDGRTGTLTQFRDLKNGHDHLESEGASRPLWRVDGRAGEETVRIAADGAKQFRWEKPGQDPNAIHLIWEDFGIPNAPKLQVTATVKLEQDAPMSAWDFTVEGLGSVVVREICFPNVFGITPQKNERLAVPRWMGEEANNPRALLVGPDRRRRRMKWSYPGNLSLQCVAYYRNNGPGFYAACNDQVYQRKSFSFYGDADSRVHFEIEHHRELPEEAVDRHALGYQVLLGTFHGDWFTAAERYRAWGVRQSWARASRLREGKTPDWVTNTGLWVWNRGRSPGVLPPASALQAKLGLPVSVFWHWWHGCRRRKT